MIITPICSVDYVVRFFLGDSYINTSVLLRPEHVPSVPKRMTPHWSVFLPLKIYEASALKTAQAI
jgi:hypothetical protein